MSDWVVTIPKSILWEDYQKELYMAEHGHTLNYKVSYNPKQVKIGDRCFIVWNGFVRGWMFITSVGYKEGFVCTTTQKSFLPGYYIGRSGVFNNIEPIPMQGFRGLRRLSVGVPSKK